MAEEGEIRAIASIQKTIAPGVVMPDTIEEANWVWTGAKNTDARQSS